MIHLGDIMKLAGDKVPLVDCIIGGSPCQDLSIAGLREGLDGERSSLFIEQVRIVKEMRAKYGVPRFMVWENVPGALSSHKGEDFRRILEEIIRVADPEAPDIPLPQKGKWALADCWFGDNWSIAYRILDAQFWGVPQRRRRIALVADFGGRSAPEILFERKGMSGSFESSLQKGESDTAGTGDGFNRTDKKLYDNHVKDGRLTGPLEIAPTVTAVYGTGGNNTPLVLTARNSVVTVRKLTPLECERLQGYPDGWTNIGAWEDHKGKTHKTSSDASRYKALGNSIALPPWRWVLQRLCSHLKPNATMGSLFDGIGGFPLIWEEINGNGSCLWASEIEDFPIAVTQRRFHY